MDTNTLKAVLEALEIACPPRTGYAHYTVKVRPSALAALRPWLPYCWHTVPGTTDLILLNRAYKPIGTPRQHANYEEYTYLHAPREIVHSLPLLGQSNDAEGRDPRRWYSRHYPRTRADAEAMQQLLALTIKALSAERDSDWHMARQDVFRQMVRPL